MSREPGGRKRRTSVEDVLPLTVPDGNGCLVWPRANNGLYGVVHIEGERVYTHRYVYSQVIGPIPDGMTIDHLCRNTMCCNPQHLEVVTLAENIRRAQALVTHCPAGHEYTPENTYRCSKGKRRCRECARTRDRSPERLKSSRERRRKAPRPMTPVIRNGRKWVES